MVLLKFSVPVQFVGFDEFKSFILLSGLSFNKSCSQKYFGFHLICFFKYLYVKYDNDKNTDIACEEIKM